MHAMLEKVELEAAAGTAPAPPAPKSVQRLLSEYR